jgi:hypothetical protein
MTRAEILDCLMDRPCEVCKFHESGRCERWECVFEEKPDEPKHISIDDAMSVFDDYMCGDIDEAGAEIFLKMLKDKAESEE